MNPETIFVIASHLGCQLETDDRYSKLIFDWGGVLTVAEFQGRIHVRGTFPLDHGHYWAPRDGDYDISLSAGKSPERIAADIGRRLLPGYRVAYESAVRQMTGYNTDQDRRKALAMKLAAIVGLMSVSSQDPMKFHCYEPVHIDGTINSEDVSLRITCRPELAESILGLIAGYPIKDT